MEWSNHSDVKKLQVCKIASSSSSQPLCIIYSITVLSDLSWSMYVHDRKLPPATCSVLRSFPTTMDSESLNTLIQTVNNLIVCPGHPDPNLVRMIKAKKCKKYVHLMVQ